MTIRIGIDVGGTNTDAVAIAGNDVLASCKYPTTTDVLTGVVQALRHIVEKIGSESVDSVVIGTTHFVNAVTEARKLSPVVAMRLSTPPHPLTPFTDWPERLCAVVQAEVHMLSGGHQFTGLPLNPPDLEAVREIAASATGRGLSDFMVSSVFSPVNADGEVAARDMILSVNPDARVTMSHQLGRVGILERENAAILNAALRALAVRVVDGFQGALADVGLDVPLYLSQNDGTVMNLEIAREFPILTVASGPTNSMRGAALESGETDCVVVDVGGTTTDIGLLQAGYPRESSLTYDLGGVRTNFRMPDVLSLGIGGGSRVRRTENGATVGPDSVGHEITTKSIVFGGDELTLTDVVVAAGRANIGDASLVNDLDPVFVQEALDHVRDTVALFVDKAKIEPGDIPVVLVGGGALLLGSELPGASKIIRPENSGVANAIGAAMANVGGEVDRLFSLAGRTRVEALEFARDEAVERAVAAGASRASVRVVDEEDIPIMYLPEGTATRIRVRVIGDIDRLAEGERNEENTHATA